MTSADRDSGDAGDVEDRLSFGLISVRRCRLTFGDLGSLSASSSFAYVIRKTRMNGRRPRAFNFIGPTSSFTGLYRLLLGFQGFSWILLGFIEFSWLFLGFPGF